MSLTFAAGSVVAEALLRFVGVVSGLMFRGGLIIRLLLLALILPNFTGKRTRTVNIKPNIMEYKIPFLGVGSIRPSPFNIKIGPH